MARARTPAQPFKPDASMRIILLAGPEPFLIRHCTEQLAEILEKAHGAIERFDYDGSSADLASVLDEVRSYGLMQQHKLVVLNNAEVFLSGDEARRRALERYAEAPVDHATLLLRAATWRPGKLDKLIQKVGLVHRVAEVSDQEAMRWCQRRCEKRYETTIEPEAAAALVGQVGPDLERLDRELSKLASFTGPGQPITTAAVAELVGLSREEQAWVIQSALAAGDPGAAMRTLSELRHISNQPAEMIAWAITDLLRKLHAAARMLESGQPPNAVAQALRLWGPMASLPALARRVGAERLAQLLRAAVEATRRTRRGYGDEQRTLEALTLLVTDTLRA